MLDIQEAIPMTPEELQAARHQLGLSCWDMATLLGFQGKQRRQKYDDMEQGLRMITGAHARLVTAYLDGYRPEDWEEIVSAIRKRG